MVSPQPSAQVVESCRLGIPCEEFSSLGVLGKSGPDTLLSTLHDLVPLIFLLFYPPSLQFLKIYLRS